MRDTQPTSCLPGPPSWVIGKFFLKMCFLLLIFNLFDLSKLCQMCFFPLLPGRWENSIALLFLVAPLDLAVGGHFPVEEGSLESRYLIEGNQTRWGFQISRFFSLLFQAFLLFQIQILLHIMANPDHSASIWWLFFFVEANKNCFTLLGRKTSYPLPRYLGRWSSGLPVWWVPCIHSLDGSTLIDSARRSQTLAHTAAERGSQ